MEDISIGYLRECFDYDAETGDIFWRVRPRKHFNNKEGWNTFNSGFANHLAGRVQTSGYLEIRVSGKQLYGHRVAWAIHYGFWPKQIDHIDHNKTNNAICNLRLADCSGNNKNKPKRKDNKSGFNGVYWDSRCGMWAAKAVDGGKSYWAGRFNSLLDAVAARIRLNRELLFHENHGLDNAEQKSKV